MAWYKYKKQNNTQTIYDKKNEKWRKTRQQEGIAIYLSDELSRKIQQAITKIEIYIGDVETSKSKFPYLNYWRAKFFAESIFSNIFNICELLELNEKYMPKLRKFQSLEEIEEQPLVIWYLIGTYVKHSNKSYLPNNCQPMKMGWKKRYEYMFDMYARDQLGLIDEIKDDGSISEDLKLAKVKKYQQIYRKWYDYLYVRLFGKEDEKASVIQRLQHDELTKQEQIRAKKWNEGRRLMIEDMLGFFKWMYDSISKQTNLKIQDTYIYQNSDKLWALYKKK